MWKVNCEARFLVKCTSHDIGLFLRNLKDSISFPSDTSHVFYLLEASANTCRNMFSLLRSAQLLRLIAILH